MRTFQMFLEGQWQEGSTRTTVTGPFHGRPVTEVAVGGPGELERAMAFADRRAPDLRRLPLYRRAEILERMATALHQRAEAAAQVICDEAGKPIRYARAEASRAVDTLTMAAAEARRLDGEAVALDALPKGEGRFGIVRRFPVGPVAAIAPFNFPLNLVVHKVAPALAAGCPVIVKPAWVTPSAALLLAQCAQEAGLPEGGLQVVPCRGSDAQVLATDDRIKLLSFTGSAEVGWRLKCLSGRKKVVLELGGNAGVLVMPDADWSTLLSSISVGAFAYSGQVCISVQRVMVPENQRRRFEEAFAAHVQANVPSGDPTDPNVINGPMIDRTNADRVVEWMDEARQMGARVMCGGQKEGQVVTPAVLTDVDPRTRVYQEEVFGPVVNVEGFANLDDAIARLNRSRFGLQAGVFTNDLRALWRCYEELEVGGVIHNDVPTFRVDHMPYGGVKDSGFGREGIRYALEEMTERRLLALNP